jgi:N-acetylglucosaminyldiphosphoundecaprenol N-acetyl-beta-D-mannosaminyltransferase
MRKTVDILGVPVDSVTMEEAVSRLVGFISEEGVHTVYTPNAEIMMAAQRDARLKDILKSADLLVADGAGVVLASRLLGRSVPEKVSGVDLIMECFKVLSQKHSRFYLFGSKKGVAETAARNVEKDYPGIEIAGCMDGYFSEAEEDEIINRINASNTDILLVALGAPRQEKWIARNMKRLKVRVCIGVGGSLDILAGTVALAPDFFRRNGLEWLFRLYKEPRRAKRMLDLPRFMIKVMGARLRGR